VYKRVVGWDGIQNCYRAVRSKTPQGEPLREELHLRRFLDDDDTEEDGEVEGENDMARPLLCCCDDDEDRSWSG